MVAQWQDARSLPKLDQRCDLAAEALISIGVGAPRLEDLSCGFLTGLVMPCPPNPTIATFALGGEQLPVAIAFARLWIRHAMMLAGVAVITPGAVASRAKEQRGSPAYLATAHRAKRK
jgi:hypothetical protein